VTAHAIKLFQDEESAFIGSLSEFVGAALGAGGACIVIATRGHRRSLDNGLHGNGIDVRLTAGEGRYVALDAREMLGRFMIGAHPDRQQFNDVLAPVLLKARRSLIRSSSTLSIFGEMADVLRADGNSAAAVELEQLWNELGRMHRLGLRCGYLTERFPGKFRSETLPDISSQPTGILPGETLISLRDLDQSDEMVKSLQESESAVQAIAEDREKEVAHRKVVEEKLRRSEEFTRNIIESSVDCVKVLDLEGRIQYMSPSGQRALEITDPIQFLNKSWTGFWKEEDKENAERALSAARSGGVGCFQGDSILPSGQRKNWDVRVTPALGRGGEIERLVAVSRDITELRSAQHLATQSEKLAAAGRMAATIAHEINNPLEAVTNFIYLAMTAKGLPEEVCRHLEIADRELARVAQIAQQTLGFYRGNSKDRWIPVADTVRDVLIVFERKMAYKRIHTRVAIDPDLKVYCRQGELRQALSNLLANAIDASRDEGTIWLRAHPTWHWNDHAQRGVRITLADNGTGMPREIRERIFIPFFTTKADVGTGIGLWATKTMIEQQGGRLSFRSRQGAKSGTTMSIFLPDLDAMPESKATDN
jgi:PAS domain S-box-containing protein